MNISPLVVYPNSNIKNSKKRTFANSNSNLGILKNDVVALHCVKTSPSYFTPNFSFAGVASAPNKGIQSLYEITASSETAQKLVEQLTKNPMESKQNVRNLLTKYNLKSKEGLINFSNWCLSPKGYYGAYEKFVGNYFNNAGSIEDLLKFQPNWAPWKLEEKALMLKNTQNNSVSGEAKKTLMSEYYNRFREIPFHIGNLPPFVKSQLDYDYLVSKLKMEDINKQAFNFGGINVNVSRLKGGDFNDKFIYLVATDDKKFVLKFDRINIEDANTVENRGMSLIEQRAIRKNKYLSADSIYSNACISKYLELNNCDLVPKLEYYDHKTHSAVFEYVEDAKGDAFQQMEIKETPADLNKLNFNCKKLNALGLYMNDTSEINILKTKSGEEKIIDLGHSVFMDTLKPGVKNYNIEFSNTSGPDYGAYFAALLRSFLELS